MELCKAYHSPIPCLGAVPLRGIRRTKLFPFGYLYHTTSILNNVSISRLQIHNFTRRSAVGSVGNGGSVITSMKLCKVLWSVEADVASGHILYLTGDPIALGCWNPEMAIPLSLIANTNLWKAEIKVPFGIHFKYNYFIKREGVPTQNPFWRSGPEFSVSIPLQSRESKNILVRDIWIKSRKIMAVGPLWGSWMEDKEQFPLLIGLVRHQKSHSVKNSTLVEEVFSDDILSSDRNSAKEKDTIMHTTNPGQRFSETNQPVEEPWLYRSLLSYIPESLPEETRIKVLGQQSSEAGKLVHVGQQLVHIGESVLTIILINSSVCTMQRIAILEDEKLVELLLEPVKNNVHCDSVYLGVVTKLVPHMGGAFVDIGLSRPSLMDIKKNREPFAYPPFSSKWEEVGASVEGSIKGHEDVHPHVLDLHADDDLGDEDSEVDHQDEPLHDDFEELEGDAYKRMLKKGIIDYDRTNVDFEDKYEDVNGMESEVSEELQLDKENDIGRKHSGLTSQDQNSASTHSNRNKWTHVRKGTKVIVQVVKEGLGTKGPALSAYPNLRSRFWILIARCKRIGVSKKITGAERTRLRVIAKKLQPSGFGLTVRTVAVGHSLEELQKDLEGLFSTWKGIVEHAKSAALAADEGVEGAVPVILHRAMGQTLSVVQDYFNDKVKSMVVDSPRTYHEVTKYLQDIAPDLCDRVVLYNKEAPIFDDYGIEEEINNILCKRVPLSNGGSLVIEQTEALVSIDVNGGHGMLGQGTSQEKAVLEVNLAAAKQIARELRLRDIGGIIVVDFIDMADESNKRLVYEEIKKAVERDKSMVKLSELSKHGLMEITRKRVRPSVSFLISEPCNCCQGTGRVEALETSFSKIEREICRLLATMDQKADPENAKSWPKFMLKVDRFMCNYLTTGKRTKLANLCSSLKVWILLKVARGFLRGAFEVKPFTDDNANGEVPITIPKLQSAEERPYIPNTKLMLFPRKKWKTRGQ